MSVIRFYVFIFLISSSLFSYSQIPDSSLKVSPRLSERYYSEVNKKINSISDQLTKRSLKYLSKFRRQERRIRQKMEKLNVDSGSALGVDNKKYHELSQKIKSNTANVAKVTGEPYNPYLDTLGTSLSFLRQFHGTDNKVKGPLAAFDQLQSSLLQSEKIKNFIAERKNQIKELLSKYTKIPGGLKNQFVKLNKTAYYYSAQVKEYKEMLKDPKKTEQKTFSILNKLPAFQKFMKENGQLAALFRISENIDPALSLTGLQTRSSVHQIIQQKVTCRGPNAMKIIQQNIAVATSDLNKLKEKIGQFGGGNSDIDIPDFKPNDQKTRPFLKRLEYSANVQFEKSKKLLPSVANIGLGIGYKLSDKYTAGIGLSYRMGMGSIQHISFSSQGLGLRSFMDWKIKKQFYLSSGYEMNYSSSFKNIGQLKNCDAWQRSALIGVSRKYKISKKVKGEIKLLYDFLANQHIPVSQPVFFRLGYSFK